MFQAIGDVLAFRGRLTRLGYWRWQLTLVVVGAALGYAPVAVAMAGAPRWLSALAFAPFGLALLASVGVAARRLHDRGRGVGWLIVFSLAPFGLGALSIWLSEGAAFVEQGWAAPTALGASLASLVFSVWGFVEIGLLRGTPGPNRFGPEPD